MKPSLLIVVWSVLINLSLAQQSEIPVPAGVRTAPEFNVNVFTNQIPHPRFMAITDDGLILINSITKNAIYGMRNDGTGKAKEVFLVCENVPKVHGIVTKGREVWLGEEGRILHFTLDNHDRAGLIDVVVSNLPSGGGHHYRMVAIGPDNLLYTHIGSSGNISEDKGTKRQKIWTYTLDGKNEQLFCVGLRNTEKVEWDPLTGKMWGTDNGSDNISKDVDFNKDNPTCEFNLLEKGVDYGNPYVDTDSHGKSMIRPEFANLPDIQEKLKNTRPSAFVLGGHVAPLGFTFYRGKAFPQEYQDAAFVCLHGSWNRPSTDKNGYRVDALIFKDGMPTEAKTVLNFLDDDRTRTYGRPVDAINLPDGSLLISDDSKGFIYRLSAK